MSLEINPIHTVEELIDALKKYPKDTGVFHLTGNKDTAKEGKNLFLVETHPIGDRDSEDILIVGMSSDPDAFK